MISDSLKLNRVDKIIHAPVGGFDMIRFQERVTSVQTVVALPLQSIPEDALTAPVPTHFQYLLPSFFFFSNEKKLKAWEKVNHWRKLELSCKEKNQRPSWEGCNSTIMTFLGLDIFFFLSPFFLLLPVARRLLIHIHLFIMQRDNSEPASRCSSSAPIFSDWSSIRVSVRIYLHPLGILSHRLW